MTDIVSIGNDIGLFDTQTSRAQNILSVQIGALAYIPNFGIDLAFFLNEDVKFQNDSFKSYCIQTLANYSINVASVTDTVEALFRQYTFNLVPAETTGGLMAR